MFRRRLTVLVVSSLAATGTLVASPSPAGAALSQRWARTVPGGWFAWSSPSIADINGDGSNDVVFGAFNQNIYVMDGNCREKYRFNNTDSVWSAPALADVDHDGAMEIFIGGDATASTVGLAHSGGYFRSLAVQNGQLVQRWVR